MAGKKIVLTPDELAELAEEVLRRLARDPGAAHLWQWQARPGCADEPPGPSRRRHLATLLGMVGAAALPALATGCPKPASNQPGALPSSGAAPDGGPPGPPADAAPPRGPQPCADDPCAGGCPDAPCPDDPCACPDDPC